jgi:hypothetical protein
MSSSQGANADTVSGYPFDTNSIRDASDWIRYKKEARKYTNYNSVSSDNKDTEPVWLKYGNQFRLTYSFGRWKCDGSCGGSAFTGKVGDVSPP